MSATCPYVVYQDFLLDKRSQEMEFDVLHSMYENLKGRDKVQLRTSWAGPRSIERARASGACDDEAAFEGT